jgi:hypothetical protein
MNTSALKQEVLATLKALQSDNGDPEIEHQEADKQLCLFLVAIGHADIVEQWDKVSKWYA